MMPGDSVFSEGEALWVNAKQVAHFIAPDALELRLTRPLISEHRARLKADPRVELRRSASDWIVLHFESGADVALIVELARLAAAAHQPANGAPPKRPPAGADLERRRRFH